MEEPPTRGISTYRLHAVSRIRLANSPCVSGASRYLVISILFVIVAVVVVAKNTLPRRSTVSHER